MPPRCFGFEKLIDVAEELTKRPEEEYLRTAVGRAYYYVFHLAKKRLENNQFMFFKGENSHNQVWDRFSGSPDSQCRLLGETGSMLKAKRVTADYKANYPRIIDDVQVVLEKAREFAQQLARLNPDLPRNPGVNSGGRRTS